MPQQFRWELEPTNPTGPVANFVWSTGHWSRSPIWTRHHPLFNSTTSEGQAVQCFEYTSVYVIQYVGYLRSWVYTEQCTCFSDIERISIRYLDILQLGILLQLYIFWFFIWGLSVLRDLTFKLATLLFLALHFDQIFIDSEVITFCVPVFF